LSQSPNKPEKVANAAPTGVPRDASPGAPLAALAAQGEQCLHLGQVVAERYRIVELLGTGGMGAVYRAHHVHIGKSFALKVLHRELTHNSEAVRRFEREAVAAGRIDHPNVATAIDFGRLESGAFYLVLDYVQGRSLRQLLNEEHRLPEQRALRITRQIASALAAAHAAGIVHRDLKPDNVMLVDSSGDPDFVKVLDFGIAKLSSAEIPDEPAITRFGTVFGTPEYMSPEQALGQPVDARCDLYSLGIMLYELLVGKTPFVDTQLVTILTRQMTESPEPLPASVSRELRQLVMRLLEKLPSARPANANEVLAELDAMAPGILAAARACTASNADTQSRPDMDPALVNGQTLYAKGGGAALPVSALPTIRADAPEPCPASKAVPWLPAWLRRLSRVAIRPRPVVVAALGVAMLVAGALAAFGSRSMLPRRTAREGNNTDTSILTTILGQDRKNQELMAWIESAENGDPAALQRLEQRSGIDRSAAEWAALGAGRSRAKQWPAAVVAYDRALSLEPKLASHRRTQSDLFQAALDSQASSAALETAAKRLGSTGADLIYAALEASPAGHASKLDRRKAKSLLGADELSAQISPALGAAIKLDAARTCMDYRNLLSEVETNGDQRSYRILRKLTHDRGCGLLGLQDCYACLRGGSALSNAISAAKSRPSPTFTELPIGTPSRSGTR
jgi:eukaryotic-like serine/threonine-protein kinase